jgi:hypothetical protein
MYKPRAGSGSNFQAFNVRGVRLAAADHRVVSIEAERLDDGGLAKTSVRVIGLLPFVVLKILAFQDRHEPKDAYDLVWVLLNQKDGPDGAGREMARSPVASDELVIEALQLLRERFASDARDGPAAYASFQARASQTEEAAQARQEAVEVVRLALASFGNSGNRLVEPSA